MKADWDVSEERPLYAAWDFLSSMRQDGVEIWADYGELRCRAVQGALTADRVRLIRQFKDEIIAALSGPSGPQADVRSLPLTIQQQLVWKIWPWAGKQTPCIFTMRLRGAWDIGILCESFDISVVRHEALRTRIMTAGREPRQLICRRYNQCLKVVNITTASQGDTRDEAERFILALGTSSDLSAVPHLFEAFLLRLAARSYVLAIRIDHLIADSMSMTLFFLEMFRTYKELESGRQVSCSTMEDKYGDYALWQCRSIDLWKARNEDYWRQSLEGSSRFELPIDSNSAKKQPSTAAVGIHFDCGLTSGIFDLARNARTSAAIIVLSLNVVLMARYADRKDFIIGTEIAGRFLPEHFGSIGYYSHPILLRIQLTTKETFRELVELVSQVFCTACERMDCGLTAMHHIELLRGAWFNWLPQQTCTAYEHVDFGGGVIEEPAELSAFSGRGGGKDCLAIERFPLRRVANEDVEGSLCNILSMYAHSNDGIRGLACYRADLFRPDTMQQFAKDLRMAAGAVARNPHVRAWSLPGGARPH